MCFVCIEFDSIWFDSIHSLFVIIQFKLINLFSVCLKQIIGELGYFRIETGHNSLGIEGSVVWATPGTWTERNKACYESGTNCQGGQVWETKTFIDPSVNVDSVQRRLRSGKP
jgi:hypothetical protein